MSTSRPEIYVSTDVETDGPIPGPHSMLSIASVAFNSHGEELGSFTMNLQTLEGAQGDPDTMKWWASQPDAWEACRKNPLDPAKVMKSYVDWVNFLPGKPVFVAYPAGFDFLFVYWYLIRFAGKSPFSFSALDIKTYAMAMIGNGYHSSTKQNMPGRWFKGQPKHTHIALDDARGQGMLFMAMFLENRQTRVPTK